MAPCYLGPASTSEATSAASTIAEPEPELHFDGSWIGLGLDDPIPGPHSVTPVCGARPASWAESDGEVTVTPTEGQRMGGGIRRTRVKAPPPVVLLGHRTGETPVDAAAWTPGGDDPPAGAPRRLSAVGAV